MKRLQFDIENLIDAYRDGESMKTISDRIGISRQVIIGRFAERGIHLRGRSEAESLKWSQMSIEHRRSQVAAAHEATRNVPISLEARFARARAVERRAVIKSINEFNLIIMLRERGIEVIPQQAIGPYNCDIGAAPVAVEIFGGNWHWSGRHMQRTPDRFHYILNAGWNTLVVKIETRRYPLVIEAADYVAAYIERIRRDPTGRCEYRVIRGAGETITSGSVDDDEITIIPTLTRGRNSIGQYAAVPR